MLTVVSTDPRQPAALRCLELLLADHGSSCAHIEVSSIDAEGSWDIEVSPANRRAASFGVHVDEGDEEVVLRFGHTHVYLWAPDVASLVPDLEVMAEAVFSGRLIEAGPLDDSFAVLEAADGSKQGVGRMHLPWPWRWRRTRHFEPYEVAPR